MVVSEEPRQEAASTLLSPMNADFFPVEKGGRGIRLPRMLRCFRLAVLGIVLLLTSGGCHQSPTAAPPPTPSNSTAAPTPTLNPLGYLNVAQSKLATLRVFLGPKEISAELAIRPVEIQTGMMHRTEMAENEGMLFVFGGPHRAAFYMRNTKIPLTGAYIDPDGVILELRDMKPLDETPLEAVTDRIQYVLEMKQGWFARNGIGLGTVLTTERGTLRETFFKR